MVSWPTYPSPYNHQAPRSHKEALELLVPSSPVQCGPFLPNIPTFLQHSKILPDLSLMMPFEKCTIHHQFCSRWARTYLSNHSLNHLFIPPTIHMFLQRHKHARLLGGRAGRTWNRHRAQPKAWVRWAVLPKLPCGYFSKDKSAAGTQCVPAPLCTAWRCHPQTHHLPLQQSV